MLFRLYMGFVFGIIVLVVVGYILLDLVVGMDSFNVLSVVVGIVV